MKRSFTPLLWVCATVALALSALVAIDPGGVYASYRAELSPGTPAIAAVFTAAQDGVFPWNTPELPVAPDDSSSSSATELPTPPDSSTQSPDPEVPDPPDVPDKPEDPNTPEVPDTPTYVTVESDYFDDALFIGDSHIEGFSIYGKLPNATYYWKRGLNVWSALDTAFISDGKDTLTLSQSLARHSFGKIYLLLGINELGKGTTQSFAKQYGVVLDEIRRLQPDAIIYIQAIFHVTQEKSETTFYHNEVIDERNQAIAQLADNRQVFFLDSNEVFDNGEGALTPNYTGDGVHVMAPYYVLWRNHLLEHAILRETPES